MSAKLLDFPTPQSKLGLRSDAEIFREFERDIEDARERYDVVRALEAERDEALYRALYRCALGIVRVQNDKDVFDRFCKLDGLVRGRTIAARFIDLVTRDDEGESTLNDERRAEYAAAALWFLEPTLAGCTVANPDERQGDEDPMVERVYDRGGVVAIAQEYRAYRDDPDHYAPPRPRRAATLRQTEIPIVRPEFARKTMEHFGVTGPCCDPTRGLKGGFYDAMPSPRDYCEIQRGRDFLDYDKRVRWTVGNPPWDNETFKLIALHAYEISQHVVWLLRGDTMTTNRVRDYLAAGFDVREEITVRWEDAFVATRGGFRLVLIHLERGYRARERSYWLGE